MRDFTHFRTIFPNGFRNDFLCPAGWKCVNMEKSVLEDQVPPFSHDIDTPNVGTGSGAERLTKRHNARHRCGGGK
jgi:hypothetical protein